MEVVIKMNKHKIMFGISFIFHIILLAVFLMVKGKLDVFTLILFMVSPILLNSMLAFVGTKLQDKTASFKEIPVIITYAGINVLYWISLNIQLNKGNTLEAIYQTSRQYSSDMIEISAGNSPIGALIMLLLVSFVLYYFSIRIAGKKKL
jgi:hypothetical protein